MSVIAIDEAKLRRLVSFESVEEMNRAVVFYKARYKLGATNRAVLDAISRYGCRYTGVLS